jgi:hypothetical protein
VHRPPQRARAPRRLAAPERRQAGQRQLLASWRRRSCAWLCTSLPRCWRCALAWQPPSWQAARGLMHASSAARGAACELRGLSQRMHRSSCAADCKITPNAGLPVCLCVNVQTNSAHSTVMMRMARTRSDWSALRLVGRCGTGACAGTAADAGVPAAASLIRCLALESARSCLKRLAARARFFWSAAA